MDRETWISIKLKAEKQICIDGQDMQITPGMVYVSYTYPRPQILAIAIRWLRAEEILSNRSASFPPLSPRLKFEMEASNDDWRKRVATKPSASLFWGGIEDGFLGSCEYAKDNTGKCPLTFILAPCPSHHLQTSLEFVIPSMERSKDAFIGETLNKVLLSSVTHVGVTRGRR